VVIVPADNQSPSDVPVQNPADASVADDRGPLPAHRRQVEAMAGFGLPEAAIAKVLDIDPDMLRLHYRRELETGAIKANARVAENLFRKATGEGREAVIAAIFWMKTRAGWKETSVHELGAPNLLPLRIERVIVDPAEDQSGAT
jgi:hypothetical protein